MEVSAQAPAYLLAGGGAELVSPVVPPVVAEASGAFLALAFFFLVFLAFGLVSVVVSVPAAAGVSDAPDEVPDDVPAAPLPVAAGAPEVPPLPLVPEAPDDVSPAPEAPDEGVPAAPLLPDEVPGVLGGMALELPLLLGSVAVDEGDEGDVALVPAPVPVVCASTADDTDATITNDSDRSVVFNVIGNSLN